MNRIKPVNKLEDIQLNYKDTPISKLLEYHNLGKPFEQYESAQLLIGMCMDNRKQLNIPNNFSYIIRTGGANLRYSEFKVSYAISIGEVRHIALIGHTNCGMVNLISKKDNFVNGLVNSVGWEKDIAEDHFMHFAPMFEIGNEVDFVLSETKRMRLRYSKIEVAPLMYKVEDNMLYHIEE